MRVDELRLRNFRCHEDLTVAIPDDKRIIMVVGANADGKSTIADAISFAFTGRCRGVDGAGQGLTDLVRTGTANGAPFGVSVGWRNDDGEHLLERGRSQGPKWGGQAAITKAVGLDPSFMRLCLLYTTLIDAPAAGQWGMLEEILGLKVPVEMLAFLEDKAPKHPLAFYEVAQLEERYRAERQALGRPGDAGAPPEPLEGLPADLDAAGATELLITLGGSLETLEAQERTLAEQAASAGGSLGALAEHALELEGEIATAEATLEKITTPEEAAKKREALHAQGAPLQREIDALEAGLMDAATEATKVKQELERVQKEIGRPTGSTLPKVGDACGGCGRKHTKSTITYLSARRGTVPDLTALRKQATELTATYEDRANTWEEGKAAVTHAKQRLTEHRAQRQLAVDFLDSAQARRSECERTLERNKNKLKELQIRLQQATSTEAPDPEVLSGLQARIQVGRGRYRALQEWKVARARYEADHQGAIDATERRSYLDRIITALGPKGVRQEVAVSGAAAFLGPVNEILEAFGYDLAVDLGDYSLKVNGRPLVLLSDSERIRAGLGIQYAVAKVTGLNFVVVDNADWLDAQGREVLGTILDRVGTELDQVWVLQTIKGKKEDVTIPEMDDTPWHWVAL